MVCRPRQASFDQQGSVVDPQKSAQIISKEQTMPFSSYEEILRSMLAITSSLEMRQILREIGDYADIGLDQPFGPFNFIWHAFGDNPSNISTIGLATKAGRSLAERLTNAIDGILEERVVTGIPTPPSPRQAAMQWFGRPVSGPDDGLFKWSYADGGYDRQIQVILSPSGVEAAPTVDVLDNGIGIKPEEFSTTILSLQAGNKISKWNMRRRKFLSVN